jgi:hypothetical protein
LTYCFPNFLSWAKIPTLVTRDLLGKELAAQLKPAEAVVVARHMVHQSDAHWALVPVVVAVAVVVAVVVAVAVAVVVVAVAVVVAVVAAVVAAVGAVAVARLEVAYHDSLGVPTLLTTRSGALNAPTIA